MPLLQRVVQPVDIVRIPLNTHLKGNDELQHVNMNALVGIIRQLSSLSAHAETLFADLFNEASRTAIKARHMESRVHLLADKIVQLDTSTFSANLNTHSVEAGRYRAPVVVDQNVVMKENRPPCVREKHVAADNTPPLVMFKNLREDGKDSTILYTDPHYFGRVWIAQMQKEFEANNRARTKKKNKKQSVKKEPRPVIVKEYKVDALGNSIVTESRVRKVDASDVTTNEHISYDGQSYLQDDNELTPLLPPLQPVHIQQSDRLPPPPEFDLAPPLPYDTSYQEPQGDYSPHHQLALTTEQSYPTPQKQLSYHSQQSNEEPLYDEPIRTVPLAPAPPPAPAAPPAPPAPPAPMAPGIRAPHIPLVVPQLKAVPPKAVEESNKSQNLLDSIQQYSINTLKKVTVEPKPESHYASMDVMSILSRRAVMQCSESEDSDSSGDDWEE